MPIKYSPTKIIVNYPPDIWSASALPKKNIILPNPDEVIAPLPKISGGRVPYPLKTDRERDRRIQELTSMRILQDACTNLEVD